MENIVNYINSNRQSYIDQLIEFLKIPSISNNKENLPDMQRCASFVAEELKRIGANNVSIMPTAGHPIVYGEWLGAPGRPTILCYGHYDVQPVDPIDLWESPPFEPTIRGENLYARGAADDRLKSSCTSRASRHI